jgi:hypothetical protein
MKSLASRVDDRVPRNVREHILQKENVHSVGIGLEKKNGSYTGNVCVTVIVEQKVPLSELLPEHIVPFKLNGVVVDVIEDDIPTPADESLANPGNNNELQTKVRNTAISPLAGGIAGSGGSFGTFPGSARLQDEDGNFVSITNRHIACEQNEDCTGDSLFQPRTDQQSSRFVGAVKRLGPFDPNGPAEDNIDVATIIHNEDEVELSNRYFGLRKQVEFANPELGRRIVNAGARTGFTSGFVTDIDVSTNVGFQPESIPFTGLVRYVSDGITAGGDSGSIVGYVTPDGDMQPVGNNFAGTSTSGVAMPFGKIQSFFGPLTTPAGTYPIPTSASSISLLEVAVWRMREDVRTGEAIVEYFVSNTGGQVITDTVEILDGFNPIASRTHAQIQPGTFEFDSFRISQQYFQQTLTIRTTDHVDSVLLDPPVLDALVEPGRIQTGGQPLQAHATVDIDIDAQLTSVSATPRLVSVDVAVGENVSTYVGMPLAIDQVEATANPYSASGIPIFEEIPDQTVGVATLPTFSSFAIPGAQFTSEQWQFDGRAIGRIVNEVRSWELMELELRYSDAIDGSFVDSITSTSEKVDTLFLEEGGFRSVDIGDNTNLLTIEAPTDRKDVRPVDKWFVADYNRELLDRSGDVYNLELELVPNQQKAFDNQYATSGSVEPPNRRDSEWMFGFVNGTIATNRISVETEEQNDGTLTTHEISLLLLPDEVRVFEEAASSLNTVYKRTVPDARDVLDDTSSDSRNTISVLPPTGQTQPIPAGRYAIRSWESRWLSSVYACTWIISQVDGIVLSCGSQDIDSARISLQI